MTTFHGTSPRQLEASGMVAGRSVMIWTISGGWWLEGLGFGGVFLSITVIP